MKIIDTKPGELALQLNQKEVLEESTVIKAYILLGATERRAKELAAELFLALESLFVQQREIRRNRSEQGRRAGLARSGATQTAKTTKD
jgi:hypothetical protein